MDALTRGPLPARVYWTRRLLVFATAFLLVFGIARTLGGGEDPSGQQRPTAAKAAATPTDRPTATASPPTIGPTAPGSDRQTEKKPDRKPTPPPLPEPEGPCADQDIAVTPVVTNPVAGADAGVPLLLKLRTIESEACTWRVSPETLTLKITSGKDDIWSSRQCPRAIRTQDVVVRRTVSSTVEVVWNGKRSDEECSRLTEWALPGWYHVAAAALAGEPSDVQFELERPRPEAAEPRDRDRNRDRARDKNRDKNRDERNRKNRDRR